MPNSETSVTITQGLPPDSPWVINELDTNLQNLALARLAVLGTRQGTVLETQTKVLVEQTAQLESMQDFGDKLGSGQSTAIVTDSAGKVLISDPATVSDLIGISVDTLNKDNQTAINRLIEFTANLASSSPPVNLGGQPYVSVTLNSGNPPSVLQVPLKVWSAPVTTADMQPFVCYAYKDSTGKIEYRICDQNKSLLTISSVAALDIPAAEHVYDAYQIAGVVYKPADYFGTTPTTPAGLYRNVVTGQLRLVTASGFTDNPVARGFVIPSSKDELTYWFGQAAAVRLSGTEADIVKYGVKLPVSPDTFQWRFKDTANFVGGGFAPYPVAVKSLTDTTLTAGTFVQDQSDPNKRIYLITGKTGTTNRYVEVEMVGDPFVLWLTKDNLVSIRGQLTEKITQMTQRTSEQQLFLNSLLQKHNYHLDAATNVLKAFSDMRNRLSGLL